MSMQKYIFRFCNLINQEKTEPRVEQVLYIQGSNPLPKNQTTIPCDWLK